MSISVLELRLATSVVGADGRRLGRVKQIRGADFLLDRRFRWPQVRQRPAPAAPRT